MSPMYMLVAAWGALTAVLIVVLIYKSTLTMHEDDSIMLNDPGSQMQKDQAEVLEKMRKLTPIVRVLGRALGPDDSGDRGVIYLPGAERVQLAAITAPQ